MRADPTQIALAMAGGLFLIYLLLRLRISVSPTTPEARAAEQRIRTAKQRARDRERSAPERAEAWREAALFALEGLKRPNLAASYARRAERADPSDAHAVQVLSRSLREAGRHRALERLLWRRLAAGGAGASQPALERAYDELIRLYDGPLRCPERAVVLRRMRQAPETGRAPVLSERRRFRSEPAGG